MQQHDEQQPDRGQKPSAYSRLPPFARAALWVTLLFFPLAAWLFVSAPYYTTVDEWVQRQPTDFIRLTAPQQLELGRAPLQPERYRTAFTPTNEAIQLHVRQKLEVFRGKYLEQLPRVLLDNPSGNDAITRVVTELRRWLQRYELHDGLSAQPPTPTRDNAPMTLYYPPDNALMAYDLLQALAPYLQGKLRAIPTQALPPGQLYLSLNRPPRFRADGATLFLD